MPCYRALRQQYIANGGREAALLAQIADVESAVMELDRLNHSVVNIREHRGLAIFTLNHVMTNAFIYLLIRSFGICICINS